MNHSAWRTPFVLALSLTSGLGLALGTECPVGVNVNSFQNFSAAEQQMIVEQLKSCGVSFVRTSLRPDDKNMNLAKNLQSEGIGLVLVPGVEFYPNAPLRAADPKRGMRSALPLSYADPERSRAYYQTLFDKLDAKGVVLAGVELGNEIRRNGDSPVSPRLRPKTRPEPVQSPRCALISSTFSNRDAWEASSGMCGTSRIGTPSIAEES